MRVRVRVRAKERAEYMQVDRVRVRVRVRFGEGYVPTTFTRLVRCDNRVQYTSIGIQWLALPLLI